MGGLVGDVSFNPEDFDPERQEVTLCMGRVKCVHCGKPHGVCSEVEYNLTREENTTMLPRSSNEQTSGGQRRRSGYTYITEADLSADKMVAHINAVQLNDQPLKDGQQRFSDLVLQVQFRGDTRLFGVKFFDKSGNRTPNYSILLDGLGEDEQRWVGREFYLFAEKQEFTGKIFPRVEPIPLVK